ncbi:MAG: acetyl/propionyl/methylcrotonyl-CoA carboxylase subunit alpha, partial [Acidimicrobiia bacterium]
ALHVRLADEAYALGGQTAAESYLNTDAILDVIERSGADAVHPGYGFFSENADFARTISERGVTWIGPPPEAIEVMGDKISSRKAAAASDVEAVPGTLEPITSADDVVTFGEHYGWPVAIKAAYGGGGKGLKIVTGPDTAASGLQSAEREAVAYFGRGETYLERYLTQPRHIEIQVFCDQHGNAVWLGDRDCSTQRRHQKLIEESPAVGIDEVTRAAMGEAAVKVAVRCGYVNAGTVEMLYQDGEFYFLEMNTRLQVEHCVTEMVTQLDLVAEQIRVADGEPLSFTQGSVTRRGHAIECRINAENPAKGFLPSPGTIERLRVPSGPGVRWDGGYEEGDTVSQYYDNLVGKLVVWAPDRDAARARALRALGELDVIGIHTTIPAHIALIAEPVFAAGQHSTKWLEENPDLQVESSTSSTTKESESEAEPLTARTVPVEVDGKRFSVKLWLPDAPAAARTAAGATGKAGRPKPAGVGSGAGAGGGTISAPLQGPIVKVLVAVGDTVEVGESMLVLEAMKMENHLSAEMAGTVAEVRVSAGDTVGTGDVLLVVE